MTSSRLLTCSLLALALACGLPEDGEPIDAESSDLATGVLLRPDRDIWVNGAVGDPNNTDLYRNVDDGTSFTQADNGTSTVKCSSSCAHSLGYAGPSGKISRVVVKYRATAWLSQGTIQIQLFDLSNLVAQGPVRSVASSKQWSNHTETFSGLSISDISRLRTKVLLNRKSGNNAVSYTQIWIEATIDQASSPSPTPDAGSVTTPPPDTTSPDSGTTGGKFFMATLRHEWSASSQKAVYGPYMNAATDDSRFHVGLGATMDAEEHNLTQDLPHQIKGAEFFTIADLKRHISVLQQKNYDYVDYDLEDNAGGRDNPDFPNDKNPSAFTNKALEFAQIAHANGFRAHFSPAQYMMRTTVSESQFASIVKAYDSIHWQFQVVQDEPARWREFLNTFPAKARKYNPMIRQTVQLSVQQGGANLDNWKARWNEAKPHVDGITIWVNGDVFREGTAARNLVVGFLKWFDQYGR